MPKNGQVMPSACSQINNGNDQENRLAGVMIARRSNDPIEGGIPILRFDPSPNNEGQEVQVDSWFVSTRHKEVSMNEYGKEEERSREDFVASCNAMLNIGYLPDAAFFDGVPIEWLNEARGLVLLSDTKKKIENIIGLYIGRVISEDEYSDAIEDAISAAINSKECLAPVLEQLRKIAAQASRLRARIQTQTSCWTEKRVSS